MMDCTRSGAPAHRRSRGAWRRLAVAIGLTLILGGLLVPLTPRLASGLLRWATGWSWRVGRIRVGVFPIRLRAANIEVANPAGFPSEPAIVVREFYIERSGRAPEPGVTSFRELRLDLAHIHLIRNAEGRWNYDALLEMLASSPAMGVRPEAADTRPVLVPEGPPDAHSHVPPDQPASPGPAGPEPPPGPASAPSVPGPVQREPERRAIFERVTVSIGTISLRDDAVGGLPPVELELNRTLTFTNVTDLGQVLERAGYAVLWTAAPQLLRTMWDASLP